MRDRSGRYQTTERAGAALAPRTDSQRRRFRVLGALMVLLLVSLPSCYLTARGGRELDPIFFVPGLILMVLGLKAIMARMGGPLPAWRRFVDGIWMGLFVLLG